MEVRTLLEKKVPNWWQASLGGEVGGSQLRSACHLLSCPGFVSSAKAAEAGGQFGSARKR